LCQHFPTVQFYEHALAVRDEVASGFYDALILTAAIEMDCARLLSEDLQDGRQIHGVTIRNPFAGL
jgi:predicted nucleic acid-binding protein